LWQSRTPQAIWFNSNNSLKATNGVIQRYNMLDALEKGGRVRRISLVLSVTILGFMMACSPNDTVQNAKTLPSTSTSVSGVTATQSIEPSTSQITIPSTDDETPINPWPTVWPSQTIVSNGITRTVAVHPDPPMISLDESMMVFITGNKLNPAIQTRSISANYDDIS
jgi:hypothetical protein